MRNDFGNRPSRAGSGTGMAKRGPVYKAGTVKKANCKGKKSSCKGKKG